MIFYEASFVGLMRTVLIIGLFYYGFRFLFRVVFPWVLKRWVNKKMGQFQNQGHSQFKDRQQAQNFSKEQEGEVKIKSRVSKTSADTKNMGDFIDYEEVD